MTIGLAVLIGLSFGLGALGFVVLAILAFVSLWEFISWYSARSAVLSEMNAVPADAGQHGYLLGSVGQLALRAGLPMPQVFVARAPIINAFALSARGGGIVMVTEPALTAWSDEELHAVLAHEVGHLKNRDTLWQSAARVLVKAVLAPAVILFALIALAISFSDDEEVSDFGVVLMALIGVVAAFLSALALAISSRSRELMADQSAADLGGDPRALISGLRKAEAQDASVQDLSFGETLLAPTMFVNPLRDSWVERLLASHPSIETRAKRLAARVQR